MNEEAINNGNIIVGIQQVMVITVILVLQQVSLTIEQDKLMNQHHRKARLQQKVNMFQWEIMQHRLYMMKMVK